MISSFQLIISFLTSIKILIQTLFTLNIFSYFAILNVNATEEYEQFFINSTFNKINDTILFFSQANTTLLKMWFIDLTAEESIDSAPGDQTSILLLNDFEISCKYFQNPERVQHIEFKADDVVQKIIVNDYLKAQN